MLDQLAGDDKDSWKHFLMANGNSTPLQILADQYQSLQLPEPILMNDEDKVLVGKWIDQRNDKSVLPGLFRFAYQLIF